MNFKRLALTAVLATGVSAPAFADVTGNIGVFSEYMFRGIAQSTGAAVQGGLDYSHDSGFYAGIWGSNVNTVAGGGTEASNELDVYGGFIIKAGDLAIDIGGIAYVYSEDKEVPGVKNLDFAEGYLGLSFGPLAVKGYYSPDYVGTGEESIYGTATLTLAMNDTTSVFVQAGHTDVDAGFNGTTQLTESYADFSAGVSKSLADGLSFTLAGVMTKNRDLIGNSTSATPAIPDSDEPKLVISGKKVFGF